MDQWRPALFTVAQRLARGLELGARGLMCLAAGVLHRDQLVRAISKRWNDFGEPEAYVLSGLMPWEQEFYERFLKPDDEILIVGCGSGRDLIALLRAGYRVEGLEVAALAATKARSMLAKAGLNARVTVGSIEDSSLVSKPFDVYIFSWFCYSYIPRRADRVAMLRAVGDRLKPGGRVAISYETSEEPPHPLSLALTRLTATLSRADWQPEPTDVIGLGTRGLHYEHQFAPGEFEDEAREAGLQVIFHQVDQQGAAVLVRENGRP
jgi:SAM-dependent methyltransferase